MRISLITSSHFHDDDRIYHHMAYSLSKNGHQVDIVSSLLNLKLDGKISIHGFDGNSLSKHDKISVFINQLTSFKPQVIILGQHVQYTHRIFQRLNLVVLHIVSC